MESEALTRSIIGAAMRVHGVLGPGYLESVYQKALAVELRDLGLAVECQKRLTVEYRGVIVGDFVADMLIEAAVLVENKVAHAIIPAHEVQLLNYLVTTGTEVGLLLNFGAPQLQFKRKVRTYRPRAVRAF